MRSCRWNVFVHETRKVTGDCVEIEDAYKEWQKML